MGHRKYKSLYIVVPERKEVLREGGNWQNMPNTELALRMHTLAKPGTIGASK